MASASVSKTTKSYTYRSTGGGPAEVSIEYSADLSALSRLEDKIRLLQDDLESEREFRQRIEREKADLSVQVIQLSERLEEAEGGTETQIEVNRKRDTELTKLRKLLEDVHLESEETANLLRKKHHEIVVDFQDQIDQLSKLKGKAEKEKARFQQEVYELLAQLESSNKEKLISIRQSEKLEITVRELSVKIEELNRTIVDITSHKTRLSQENIELVKEVQDLKVNIENATYLKSQLAGQLEDARRRLEDDERRRRRRAEASPTRVTRQNGSSARAGSARGGQRCGAGVPVRVLDMELRFLEEEGSSPPAACARFRHRQGLLAHAQVRRREPPGPIHAVSRQKVHRRLPHAPAVPAAARPGPDQDGDGEGLRLVPRPGLPRGRGGDAAVGARVQPEGPALARAQGQDDAGLHLGQDAPHVPADERVRARSLPPPRRARRARRRPRDARDAGAVHDGRDRLVRHGAANARHGRPQQRVPASGARGVRAVDDQHGAPPHHAVRPAAGARAGPHLRGPARVPLLHSRRARDGGVPRAERRQAQRLHRPAAAAQAPRPRAGGRRGRQRGRAAARQRRQEQRPHPNDRQLAGCSSVRVLHRRVRDFVHGVQLRPVRDGAQPRRPGAASRRSGPGHGRPRRPPHIRRHSKHALPGHGLERIATQVPAWQQPGSCGDPRLQNPRQRRAAAEGALGEHPGDGHPPRPQVLPGPRALRPRALQRGGEGEEAALRLPALRGGPAHLHRHAVRHPPREAGPGHAALQVPLLPVRQNEGAASLRPQVARHSIRRRHLAQDRGPLALSSSSFSTFSPRRLIVSSKRFKKCYDVLNAIVWVQLGLKGITRDEDLPISNGIFLDFNE